MKQTIALFLFLFISVEISSQVKLVLPENYYDDFFLQLSPNECYALDFEPEVNLLDEMDVYEGFVELRVIPLTLYTNLLRYDDDGVFLPYDLSEGEPYRNEMNMRYRDKIDYSFRRENIEFLDTIDILRDNPSRNPALVCGRLKKKEIPFEYFRYYIIDTSRFGSARFDDYLVSIYVEVKENDIMSKELRRRIVCPNEIDRELIKELNQKLIDIGYLKDDYRRVYKPEISNAIARLQKNRKLPEGFLDLRTLRELEVNPQLYNMQLFSPVGITIPRN